MGAVETYAAEQHGVVTLAQLRGELKLPPNEIRSLLERKLLVTVHRGVYRLGGSEPNWLQSAKAALLLAGPGAALSHRTAALAHGLDGFVPGPEIEVTVPANRDPGSPRGVKVYVSREEIPATIVNHLRVTSLARTFVDLPRVISADALEVALDSAHRKMKNLRWLTSYLPQVQPSRPGLPELRRAIEEQSGGFSDSPLEVEVRQDLRRAGIMGATRQLKIYDAAGYLMRVDFAFLLQKFALHVDSRFHLTFAQMNKDAEQRGRLTALGWRQMVVTKALMRDGRWIERLKALLATG